MSEPDVPLRVPLDFEYRKNKKIARRIFEEEKQKLVHLNKLKAEESYNTKQEKIQKHLFEKQKKFDEEQKTKEEYLKQRSMFLQQKREAIIAKK